MKFLSKKSIGALTGLFLMVFWCGVALAMPAQVIVIRHGEKPPVGDNLTVKGQERAEALVPYFLNTPALTQYGPPIAIYAEAPNDGVTATRAMETCSPLAKALGIPVLTPYTRDQYVPLAQDILNNPQYSGKMVLICWEHKNIPPLVNALGIQPMPAPWAGNVFDRTLVLTYRPDGKIVSFQSLPQQLMYGDSTS